MQDHIKDSVVLLHLHLINPCFQIVFGSKLMFENIFRYLRFMDFSNFARMCYIHDIPMVNFNVVARDIRLRVKTIKQRKRVVRYHPVMLTNVRCPPFFAHQEFEVDGSIAAHLLDLGIDGFSYSTYYFELLSDKKVPDIWDKEMPMYKVPFLDKSTLAYANISYERQYAHNIAVISWTGVTIKNDGRLEDVMDMPNYAGMLDSKPMFWITRPPKDWVIVKISNVRIHVPIRKTFISMMADGSLESIVELSP